MLKHFFCIVLQPRCDFDWHFFTTKYLLCVGVKIQSSFVAVGALQVCHAGGVKGSSSTGVIHSQVNDYVSTLEVVKKDGLTHRLHVVIHDLQKFSPRS